MHRLAEILLSPKKAGRHPFEILFVGFFYALLSIFLALWIFPDAASVAMIFLAVIACLYLIQGIVISEEVEEQKAPSEEFVLKQHAKTVWTFFLLFMGFLSAYIVAMFILPEGSIQLAFATQEATLNDIRSITGRSIASDTFLVILSNNIRVLFLSVLFALFYGAGSIFILAWNASLMGFVIGGFVKNVGGLLSLPQVMLRYFIHGVPEILAYLAGALAGSILFIAVVRGDFKKEHLKRTAIDTGIMIIISLGLLILAAGIETYISPHI